MFCSILILIIVSTALAVLFTLVDSGIDVLVVLSEIALPVVKREKKKKKKEKREKEKKGKREKGEKGKIEKEKMKKKKKGKREKEDGERQKMDKGIKGENYLEFVLFPCFWICTIMEENN